MGQRTKQEIEQAYQQTCLRYGHTSQQIKLLEQQEYDYKKETEQTFANFQEAKEKLITELVTIEKEWNSLRNELKQVESGDKDSQQL